MGIKCRCCLIFFFIGFNVFPQEKINFIMYDTAYLLRLPYKIDDQIHFIFGEDTPLAIKIIEINVDGEALSYSDDVINVNQRTYLNIIPVQCGQREYFVRMYWYKRNFDIIYWHDGRGIIFREVEPRLFYPKINIYELNKKMKNIIIKYRVLLPYSGITINDLYNGELKDQYYTDEYCVSIDINQVFK
jgi:hypothetical protein